MLLGKTMAEEELPRHELGLRRSDLLIRLHALNEAHEAALENYRQELNKRGRAERFLLNAATFRNRNRLMKDSERIREALSHVSSYSPEQGEGVDKRITPLAKRLEEYEDVMDTRQHFRKLQRDLRIFIGDVAERNDSLVKLTGSRNLLTRSYRGLVNFRTLAADYRKVFFSRDFRNIFQYGNRERLEEERQVIKKYFAQGNINLKDPIQFREAQRKAARFRLLTYLNQSDYVKRLEELRREEDSYRNALKSLSARKLKQ